VGEAAVVGVPPMPRTELVYTGNSENSDQKACNLNMTLILDDFENFLKTQLLLVHTVVADIHPVVDTLDTFEGIVFGMAV
jgi:hypothetical protein